MSRARTTLVLAMSALAACADEPPPPITELSIDTLADGSILVSNPPHGLWDANPGVRWRLVESLRIGSAVAEEVDAFGNVVSFTLDELGRLWIGDSQGKDVRVFDADGQFVRTVGQPGEGPGEFGSIGSVRRGPEGHIWVRDSDLGRYEVFDTAGKRIGGHRMPNRFGGSWRSGVFFQSELSEEHPGRWVYKIHRLAANGTLEPDGRVFELLDPPPDPPMLDYTVDGQGYVMPAPLTPNHDWVFGSEFDFWWSDGYDMGGRYEIHAIDLESGDTLRTIVRQYEPVAISDAVRIAAVESQLNSVRLASRFGARRPSEKAMRVVPHVYPPFESFSRSRDGTLWVRRYVAEGVEGFDIFDSEGRYLGQPELPDGFGSMSVWLITEDRMYAIDSDELGVDYVVRLEIVRPG